MITKIPEEITLLNESGKRLAHIFAEVAENAVSGASGKKLDQLTEALIREGGDVPAFLHYTPQGSRQPYPATLCVSINDEVVHGIPGERQLKDGDIVGLDLGLSHKGFFVDMAMTIAVGEILPRDKKLIDDTKEALQKAIEAIKPGGHIGDIGHAIESFAKPRGYGIVYELGGHGVGKVVHEKPYVPNFGKPGTGPALVPGLVIAIEPMLTLGSPDVVLASDGFTFKTRDGSRSAHFEHTVLITETGAEILTKK